MDDEQTGPVDPSPGQSGSEVVLSRHEIQESLRHQRAPEKKQYSKHRGLIEWVVVLTTAIVLAFVVRTFVFQTFYIPSGSMEPTLQIGDRIIVSKLSYDVHGVNRGDIVVFHAPPAEAAACADPNIKDLVKRVIGLPGETISSRGNDVLIDGKAIAQPWFPPTNLGTPIKTTYITANHYFVMGDNRADSCDSRFWGTLPKANIIGHVVFRIWPLSQIGIPS
jgi:signal peptidase I